MAAILAAARLELSPAAQRRLRLERRGPARRLQEARKLRAFGPENSRRGHGREAVLRRRGELDLPLPGLARRGEPAGEPFGTLHPTRTRRGRSPRACDTSARVLSARLLFDEKTLETEDPAPWGRPSGSRDALSIRPKPGEQRLACILDRAIELDVEIKKGHVRPADALLELVVTST